MKFDNVVSNILIDISTERKVDVEIVGKIVNGAMKSIRDIISEKEVGVIKMDYLGKFTYNKRYKEKKQNLKKNEKS